MSLEYCKCLVQNGGHKIRLCPRTDRRTDLRPATRGTAAGRAQNHFQRRRLTCGNDEMPWPSPLFEETRTRRHAYVWSPDRLGRTGCTKFQLRSNLLQSQPKPNYFLPHFQYLRAHCLIVRLDIMLNMYEERWPSPRFSPPKTSDTIWVRFLCGKLFALLCLGEKIGFVR